MDLPVKLSDYVMQYLAGQGVKHVFMLPGGGAMHLNDSLGSCEGVTYTCTLQQRPPSRPRRTRGPQRARGGHDTGPGSTCLTASPGRRFDARPVSLRPGETRRPERQ